MFISINKFELQKGLGPLKKDALPLWGTMTAVQMVEHLIAAVKMSNGKLKAAVATPEEKLPKVRQFLFSDQPMPRNVKADALKSLFPEPSGNTLEELIQQLEKEINDFYSYYKNAGREENHPVFGSLDKEGWERLHSKHFTHHFVQFGLLPE